MSGHGNGDERLSRSAGGIGGGTSGASSPTLDPSSELRPALPPSHVDGNGNGNGDGNDAGSGGAHRPATRASDLEQSAPPTALQTSAVPADRLAASGRYLLTAFHARGGM